MIKKSGSAKWSGDLKTGKGQVSSESGTLKDNPYGFNTRFDGRPGTNPEELIGAAHASCFAMALSNILRESDLVADSIDAKSTVTLEKLDGGFEVTRIHLDVSASIPDADDATFQKAAKTAKENCPISKLLKADITMEAKLA